MEYQHIFPKKVYHATVLEHYESIKNRILINRPDAKIKLDFGKGFYTTTILEQAEGRASELQEALRDPKKRTLRRLDRGIVITFELNIEQLYNVNKENYTIFKEPDIEWAEFIVKNRTQKRHKLFNHNYHWTYGPMADGSTPYLCEEYSKGFITPHELMNGYYDKNREEEQRGISPYVDNYDQLVFHDETFVNSGILTNPTLKVIPNLPKFHIK